MTAIRNADLDDNVRTAVDVGGSPFLNTLPHPEYPAAHGVIQSDNDDGGSISPRSLLRRVEARA